MSPNLAMISVLLLLGVVALACIIGGRRPTVLGWLTGRARSHSPYSARPLLTAWERRALLSLRQQVPRGFYVCPQVRLADMLTIADGLAGGRAAALNRVAGKSVDFAIVRLETGQVMLVVELDDRTHATPVRRERDRFVNKVLEAAGIPILRFRPNQQLDVRGQF